MMAKKIINKELKNTLSELMNSTGKGEYSSKCDELLVRIKHLNKTLNSKEQLQKIESLVEKIIKNNDEIKEVESHLKNEDFYYKLKKVVLHYPFSAKRSKFLRAIKSHKSFLEEMKKTGNILGLNALYSEIEEIQEDYCYHLILKNLFNNHNVNKKIVKEMVYYKTASMSDLVDDDIIEDFFSMILLNQNQLSNIKRCFYYKSNAEFTQSKIDNISIENERYQDKIESFIYENNETYSF